MTVRIALSQALASNFEAAVADFIKARKAHQSTEGEPAPFAPSPIVEAAVRRVPGSIDPPVADDFVADYEIVDDTPEPPTIEERKRALAQQAGAAAQEAIHAIIPPLKDRLWSLQYADVLPIEPAKRTPEQAAIVEAHEARMTKVRGIVRQLAETESAIHDLTDATIDQFKLASFAT